MSATERRGCGVYIFNAAGRVLLTQRGPNARHEQFKWEGPGGSVDPGETFEIAAQREILEELGVSVELGEVISHREASVDSSGTEWEEKTFKGSIHEVPRIQEPDKCVGFGWFDREEVARLSLADYTKKDLRAYGWL